MPAPRPPKFPNLPKLPTISATPLAVAQPFDYAQLMRALSTQNIGLWHWDMHDQQIFWSDGVHQLLGIEPYALPRDVPSYLQLVHPDDRDTVEQTLTRWSSTLTGLHRLRHRLCTEQNSLPRWIEFSGHLELDQLGHAQMIGLVRDISQRQLKQHRLDSAEQRIAALFNASPEALLVFDRHSRHIVQANQRFAELFDWPLEQALGSPIEQLNWLPDELLLRLNNQAIISEEVALNNQSGQAIHGLLHAQTLELMESQQVFVSFLDLTHLHETQAALKNSEKKFISAFHGSPNACSISEFATGRFLEVNVNFIRRLGYSSHEAKGHTSFELGLWPHPDDRQKVIDHLLREQRLRDYPVRLRHRDGSIGDYLLNGDRLQLQGKDCLCLSILDVTKLNQQQQALEHSREQLNLALQAAKLGTWECDIAQGIIRANAQTCALHGFAQTEYQGRLDEYLQVIHPADRNLITEAFDKLFKGRVNHYQVSFRVIFSNGECHYLESTAELDRTADGAPKQLIGVMRDITQSTLNQQRLKASEERFASLFQGSPVPVSLTRVSDRRFIDVNQSFCKTFGYERTQLLNSTVPQIEFWRDPQAHERAFDDLRAHGSLQNHPCEFRHYDGHTLHYEVSSRFLNIDGDTCILTNFHDISHVRQAEQALRAERTKFSLAFHSSPDAITITEIDTGRYIEVNEGFTRLTGLTSAQVIGRTAFDVNIWAYPEERGQMIELLRRDGQVQGFEMHGRHCDGSLLQVLVSVIPIELENKHCLLLTARDISRQKKAEERIQHLAYHDALTNLPNRALLLDRLQQQLLILERQKLFGALLFMDLDHFKNINDSLGHACGDGVLQEIALRLSQHVRGEDTIARLGGDEFVVLLFGLDGSREEVRQHVTQIAEKIRRVIAEPMNVQGHNLQITPSIGIALIPDHGKTADSLLMHADLALYKAKGAGRNTAQIFKRSLQQAANKRLQLHNELRSALSTGQFQLHYQPQVTLPSLAVTGAEALLRWQHPERGAQSPADFIEILEETGLIIDVGNWVVLEACQCLARLLANNLVDPEKFTLAVNISPRQFRQAQFVENVEYALATSGIDGRLLKLEITEGIVISDFDDTVAKMQQLKRHGVGFAIDDFGTGYSSLTYLKRMPVDVLKIDQSFVRDCTQDANDAGIIQAIIAMGHSLNLQLIAEGVEMDAQQSFLLDNACQRAQGYLYSRPLSEADFGAWLSQHHPLRQRESRH